MPREYRTTQPGTPALSPLQFGSEGLNLQTPQYQAQTNVEKPEDIFGQLQQMLGTGVSLVNMMNQQKTQDIKDKLSYDSFVQQQADRKNANKAETIRARGTMELAKLEAAGDKEGIIALRDANLKDEKEASTEEVFASALIGGQANAVVRRNEAEAAVEARRAENELSQSDKDKVISQYRPQLQQMSRNNDISGMEMMEKEIRERRQKTTNPNEQEAYTTILESIEIDHRRISSSNEETQRRDEYAVLGALQKNAADALAPFVDKLMEDPKFLSDMGAVSGEARRRAIHDALLDLLVGIDEGRLVNILKSEDSSPKEIETVMNVLRVHTDQLMDAASRQGANDRRQAAVDKTISAASFLVSVGAFDEANAVIRDSDAPMSDDAKSAHLRNNAVEYINVVDPVLRRDRISELLSKDDPLYNRVAAAAEQEMINTANTKSAAERGEFIQNRVALGAPLQPHGWVALYTDRSDMVETQFHRQLGVDITDKKYVMTPREMKFRNKLYKEWQQDSDASGRDVSKMDKLQQAADLRARETISADDIFDESELGLSIASGEWGKYSHAQLVQLVYDSSVGYKDRIIPSKLIKAVTNHLDAPMGQRLARAFFHEHTPLTSPQLSVILGDNKELSRAYMGSVYANQLLRAQTNTQVVDARTGEFIRNLASLDRMNPESDTPEGRKLHKAFNTAINNITKGSGFWSKETEDAFTKMPQGHDRSLFTSFAAMAQATGAPDPAEMATELMINEGYVFTTTANGPIDIVYNGPDRDGNRALPDNDTLRGDLWKEYMDSLAPLAVEAYNADLRKQGKGDAVADTSKVMSVVLAPTPTGLEQGFSEVALRVGSETVFLHPLLMNVSAAGFNQWLAERRRPADATWSAAEGMLHALPGSTAPEDREFNLYGVASKTTHNAEVFAKMRYDNPRRKTPVAESKSEGRKDPTR